MTKDQREHIEDCGPYKLRPDGTVMSIHGVAMATLTPSADHKPCEWDRAVVAALNDICKAKEKEKTPGRYGIWCTPPGNRSGTWLRKSSRPCALVEYRTREDAETSCAMDRGSPGWSYEPRIIPPGEA